MNNRKDKLEKRKNGFVDESSDEDANISDENSNLPLNDDDNNESLNTTDTSDLEDGISSDSNSDNQFSKPRRKKHLPSNILLSDSSDSSDDTQEKCTICLRSINNQEVGSPEGCDHLFCSICIIEWSKNSNVCPLDRQQFSIILIRKNKNGKVIKQLPIEEPKSFYYHYSDEDDTHCEICGESNREDRMLLCDGCERGFHIECLTPPLEEVPTEDEWFCPSCLPLSSISSRGNYNRTLSELEEELCRIERRHGLGPSISGTLARAHRSRFIIRTQLLERIRRAISKMILKCLTDSDEDNIDTEDADFVTDDAASEDITAESITSENKPGPSGLQRKRKRASSRKRKTYKKKTVKKTASKRKTKRKTQKRKSGKSKTKTKKKAVMRTRSVKITSTDERMKIFHPLTFKRRRKLKVKKKVKTAASRKRTSGASNTPKTVKGRLALTLGIVPPKKPGQLLPEIKVKPSSSRLSSIDINRARAGIPTLHIFEPRNELVVCNSSSDGEDIMGDENGPVATLVHPRTSVSSLRDRKRAALLLQSTTSTLAKSKPLSEESPKKEVDFLGSILDSQAIWHSKNTNVKINEDGSIEVLKKTEQADKNPIERSRSIDITGTTSEGITTQAPMYPGSGSRPGGFRPNNRNSFGESRGGHENSLSGRSSSNQSGIGFNRFGGAQRNDREGYANYLNNVPQGPTPFCRGGPPLRFRMPSRQQLRRISFPPRTNRSPWPNEEEEENVSKNVNKEKQSESNPVESKKTDEEEIVDLYSDIETNMEKAESSEHEEATATSYRVLGPPPEPSAFLLGIDENGEIAEEKNKSDVYDPAEPCDSEDEIMIIEESGKPLTPEENECKEPQTSASNAIESLSPISIKSPKQISCQRGSTEDEDDECPIFSIYSSTSREFSQKEEEEREREIAEEKRKLEETKLRDEKLEGQFKPQNEGVDKGETIESNETEDKKLDSQNNKIQKIDSKMVATKSKEKTGNKLPLASKKGDEKCDKEQGENDSCVSDALCSEREKSPLDKQMKSTSTVEIVRMKSLPDRCPSAESEKSRRSKTPYSNRGKSSSVERSLEKKIKRKSKRYESDSESESKKLPSDDEEDEDEKGTRIVDKIGKTMESENESVQTKVATGLEGLDVEEVSSDNGDGDDFVERRSLSSLSLSELSNRSKDSSHIALKKKKKKKRRNLRKTGKKDDDELRVDVDKQKLNSDDGDLGKIENENIENEGKYKKKKSKSIESDRQILGTKENKKDKNKDKERDLSWKKPSKKEKNYREGKKRSRDRGRSRSKEERRSRSKEDRRSRSKEDRRSRSKEDRRSRSFSPKKDKKKNRDRKKKSDKKKDIERYDVRKIVKNKEIRKTDAFGRDILSKSRSISRSRSRSPIRGRSRNMLRRDSRSYSRSRSRSYRRGRSPVRRRYLRSRSKTRSKSLRKSFSRSRSRSIRKSKKKFKSKSRLKERSRSRGRKSRSRRRSPSRSRSRSPVPRLSRGKKQKLRRSWSNHSRSLSFSPRRSKSITRSPIRMRRSYSRSVSSSWSGGRTPLPRTASLEKLTVVLKTKDKKKGKKKKEGKKGKRDEERRKKVGNSKEVFASGDNVLVSVNFRSNNNASSNNNNGSASNDTIRNTRMDSLSPAPSGDRKKRRESDYEFERNTKKLKKSSTISKNVVDVALSNSGPKRAKKLTRLNEKDAEVILNRKPVAVIDLDISPYREQTPSPINVVVVSDSGSGDEEKEQTPQRQNIGRSPGSEPEKNQETADVPSTNASLPVSPVANGYLTGPKTPPEPQIKFSIAKPPQLRQIANPLGDDDDDEEDEEEAEAEDEEHEGVSRMESLDRRIEKELDASHKGPNTPPEPRGPSTPKTPPSPQSSPDAYDPFEPTKSRSPTPSQTDKEEQQSPSLEQKEDQPAVSDSEGLTTTGTVLGLSEIDKISSELMHESNDDANSVEIIDKGETVSAFDCSSTVATAVQPGCAPVSDVHMESSPERKISVVVSTTQTKVQSQITVQKAYTPILKQLSMAQASSTPTSTNSSSLTTSFSSFSLPSPTKSTRTNSVPVSQPIQVTGIQRLQHRLGSPVNRTPNSLKSTPEKRLTPRTDFNDVPTSGNYRTGAKRNGEQTKQMRPLQDSTNETIDMTVDMDDSPYSPASSEGDDLFDPPMEPIKLAQQNPKTIQPGYKPPPRTQHKSPVKQLSKFDLLFGSSGPTLSPLKVGNKKPKVNSKPSTQPKISNTKTTKKCTSKRGIALKMDEDQLRILDELPSSAVELQVKDKFLKKLNRQERVVDEVKTVLKPHYARKHITKEEYKDILRRSVPKICHSRSGEINPSKIQSLIEAYVRKFRHAKKKGSSDIASKPKVK